MLSGDGNKHGKKGLLSKKQLCTSSALFCTFLCCCFARLQRETSRNILGPVHTYPDSKNFHVHTYPYSNRTCPNPTRIHSSTQDSSGNIGNRACIEVAILNTKNTVFTVTVNKFFSKRTKQPSNS